MNSWSDEMGKLEKHLSARLSKMAPFNHTSCLPERDAKRLSVPVKTEACEDPRSTCRVPDRDATLVHILDPISECVLNVQLLYPVTVATPQPHVRSLAVCWLICS